MAIPSISQIQKNINAPAVKTEVEAINSTLPEAGKNEKVTLDQLSDFWKVFQNKLNAQDRYNDFSIMSQPFQFDGNTIELQLSNSVQEEFLNNLKPELMGFLRKELKNSSLSIFSKVAPVDTSKKLYTQKDKLNYLAEKNPLLNTLVNTLGMDPDF